MHILFVSVTCDSENVVISAVKLSEDSDDSVVLRCSETNGKAITAQFSSDVLKAKWKADFKALEIKTFIIRDGKAEITVFLEFS